MDGLERGSDAMVRSTCAYNCATESPIDTVHNIINWGLLSILVLGLILGTYLIYRKHEGEKGLWKRFLKRNLIYIFIIIVLWCGFNYALWYIIGYIDTSYTTIRIEN